jgi:hypothetical protein
MPLFRRKQDKNFQSSAVDMNAGRAFDGQIAIFHKSLASYIADEVLLRWIADDVSAPVRRTRSQPSGRINVDG